MQANYQSAVEWWNDPANEAEVLPYKCQICIGKKRAALLAEEKGRGHLNATEINECSFGTLEELAYHRGHKHPNGPGGETPTQNRLHRLRMQKTLALLAEKRAEATAP